MDRDCPSHQIPVLFWKANGKEWTVLITKDNWNLRIQQAADPGVIKPAFKFVTLVTPNTELPKERVLFAMPAVDFLGIMKAYEVQIGSLS